MYGFSGVSFRVIAAALSLGALASNRAFGQVLKGAAAFGSWQDDKPGTR
jgi:hypothetical protein